MVKTHNLKRNDAMSKHYIYVIEQDPEPYDPRKEDDGYLGTMWCAHRRYNLGDEMFDGDAKDLMKQLVEIKEPGFTDRCDNKFGDYITDREERKERERQEWSYIEKAFDKYYLSRNLYLYDHSGLAMNTGGFSCHWDSGQVGMIVASKEKVREHFMVRAVTKKVYDRAMEVLDSEVKEYSQYLEGDVYGFRVLEVPDHIIEEYYSTDPDYDLQEVVEYIDPKDCEEVESCWGFYGDEYAIEEAKDMVAYLERTYDERLAKEAGQLLLPLAA